MVSPKTSLALLPLVSALALAGCGGDSSDNDNSGGGEPLSLTILHINDHHSNLEASSLTLDIAGAETTFDSGGFPRVVAKIAEREAARSNVLKLHAGDAITGTLYFSSFEGEADAELMNQVCFDAFALGNHEFDRGDAGLKKFLDYLADDSCGTPVLAANVKPQVGTPLAPNAGDDYIKPYVIHEVDGQQVGIIGIDIAGKTQNSSSPLDTTEFLDEQETAQAMIDELADQGVNKIILLTHYQYQNDLEMAANLSGVDVIIGGDSHTLLGDFADYGLAASGDYPTIVTNADGDQACVAQAWQYSQVVGELNVEWDADGNVTACAGVPYLLLGDSITRKTADDESYEPEGTERQQILAAVDADAQLSLTSPDLNAQTLLAGFTEQLDEFQNIEIGTATEDLCLARIPGREYGDPCPSEDPDRGGDIPNVVANAFLFMSKEADVSIQNAGGVRIDIPAGPITIGDAYTLLPFGNTLTNLDMTGAEIRQVLNEAVDYAHSDSSGAYPYASGLRWYVDMNRAEGERLYDIEYRLRNEGEWQPLDDTTELTVVSNSFTASGQDGYLTFGTVSEDGRAVDTFLDYAQSFVDYMMEVGTVGKPALEAYSTRHYTPAAE
ncbi:NAD nucleotidase [Alloalcanivorax xenomutans]|uniref:NAD nucleotidase n=1 Tax=Alloalcanivorax xenomutans TaxID=1094342 RepID=UPI0003B82B67|nr:NAD nucleotidase [Alloalcanivorax xenomutans]ERS13986.1 metallophosphatase [Alcanivorax sp. PN-3]KYZ87886.1 bifunctional metallophosphatase/5'-nucleotidase [Alcanivorax sp. KX64203]WOA29549.1 NAD nucleotidase [Alloalcanivorax xenomutans]WOD26528.1 NAD nucleotidase [Alloalcanivorax xenomutans]